MNLGNILRLGIISDVGANKPVLNIRNSLVSFLWSSADLDISLRGCECVGVLGYLLRVDSSNLESVSLRCLAFCWVFTLVSFNALSSVFAFRIRVLKIS